MAEPSGNRGIEYLFSDDGKYSRYVAGFLGDLSDVKDIHSQPLCVGNMVTMLRGGEPYEQMIILNHKRKSQLSQEHLNRHGAVFQTHLQRRASCLPDNRTPILPHSLLSRSETGQGACQAASKNRGPNSVRAVWPGHSEAVLQTAGGKGCLGIVLPVREQESLSRPVCGIV